MGKIKRILFSTFVCGLPLEKQLSLIIGTTDEPNC